MSTKTKEEQQGRILEYHDFDLIKFKVSAKGVEITHHEGGLNPIIQTTSSEHAPHPELKEKMDQLQLYMAQILGLLDGWDYSRANIKFKDSEEALKGAKSGHDEAVSRCSIGGLVFLGEGETMGVKITGSIKTPKAGSVGLSTPKITFESEKLGVEEEVAEICEEIKKEVYAYRFQGKKHQTDIETEIAKQENPDLFVEPGDQKNGFDENGEKPFDVDGALKDIEEEEKKDEEIV